MVYDRKPKLKINLNTLRGSDHQATTRVLTPHVSKDPLAPAVRLGYWQLTIKIHLKLGLFACSKKGRSLCYCVCRNLWRNVPTRTHRGVWRYAQCCLSILRPESINQNLRHFRIWLSNGCLGADNQPSLPRTLHRKRLLMEEKICPNSKISPVA